MQIFLKDSEIKTIKKLINYSIKNPGAGVWHPLAPGNKKRFLTGKK
jgi:hypothetical protein